MTPELLLMSQHCANCQSIKSKIRQQIIAFKILIKLTPDLSSDILIKNVSDLIDKPCDNIKFHNGNSKLARESKPHDLNESEKNWESFEKAEVDVKPVLPVINSAKSKTIPGVKGRLKNGSQVSESPSKNKRKYTKKIYKTGPLSKSSQPPPKGRIQCPTCPRKFNKKDTLKFHLPECRGKSTDQKIKEEVNKVEVKANKVTTPTKRNLDQNLSNSNAEPTRRSSRPKRARELSPPLTPEKKARKSVKFVEPPSADQSVYTEDSDEPESPGTTCADYGSDSEEEWSSGPDEWSSAAELMGIPSESDTEESEVELETDVESEEDPEPEVKVGKDETKPNGGAGKPEMEKNGEPEGEKNEQAENSEDEKMKVDLNEIHQKIRKMVKFHRTEKMTQYKCLICSKSFEKHAYASRHVRIIHFKQRKPCKWCGRGFYDNRNLFRHEPICKRKNGLKGIQK